MYIYCKIPRVITHSLVLLTVWLISITANAQERSFELKNTVIAGTCEANPSITVEVENSTFPAGTQYQYTLYNITTKIDGVPVTTTDDTYTFTNLTEGVYRVEVMVRDFYTYTKMIDNISVPVVYQRIKVAVDQTNSRNHSYACGTGRMQFIITGGNGAYTLSIADGPMRVGETVNYERVAGTDYYILEGNDWKPGAYKLHVKDQCNKVEAYDFTISPITAFPQLAKNVELSTTDCNKFVVYAFPEYYRGTIFEKDVTQGEVYEIGVKMPWMSEEDVTWRTVKSSYYKTEGNVHPFVLPADYYTMSNQYPNEELKYEILYRAKNCPETQQTIPGSFRFNKTVDMSFASEGQFCNGSNVVYLNASSAYCYPLSGALYWVHDGVEELLGEDTKTVRDSYGMKVGAMPSAFFEGKPIVLKGVVTDALGHTGEVTKTLRMNPPQVRYGTSYGLDCEDTYSAGITNSYYFYGESKEGRFTCQVVGTLYNNATGEVVETINTTSSYVSFKNLLFGVSYKFVFHYGANPNKEYTVLISKTRSTSGVYNKFNSRYITDGGTALYVMVEGAYSSGSTITVTFPTGEIVTDTFKTGSSAWGSIKISSPLKDSNGKSYFPIGRYKLDFYNVCTSRHTWEWYEYGGGTIVEDFGYTLHYLCGEAYVKPYAVVRNGRTIISTSQYRFFIYPKGDMVERRVIYSGDSIRLSAQGEYELALTWSTDFYNDLVHYKRHDQVITVKYGTPSSVMMDPERSFSYVCGENVAGQIYLQAMNGVPPYTYKLYTDSTLQHPAVNTDGEALVVTGSDYAHFQYGRVDDIVYAQITDKCGSSSKIPIRLRDVTKVSVAYAHPDTVCEGSPVTLRLGVPETLKSQIIPRWYSPTGALFSNTTADVVLTNTTASMSGVYTAKFTLPGCGTEVTNSVNVKIDEPISAATMAQNQYSICVGEPITIHGLETATSGVTYQWKIADRQIVDVLGQLLGDNDAYLYRWADERLLDNPRTKDYNTRFVASGTYVLQQVLAKGGCSFESNPVFVKVRACTVPINPHLMHRPIVNWNRFNHIPTKMAY